MKRKLLLAACVLTGIMSANAATEDKTSSVAAWPGNNYTSATDGIVLKENYAANTTTTGNIFSQTITGLSQGYYKLTVYANAIYTPERGFTSDAADFDSDRVFIFATGNEETKKTAVPVKYGIITTGSETYTVNAYVGTDGNLTIGMTKDKAGTNWHTIATKSLVYYGNDLTEIKTELNTEISAAKGLTVAATETAALNSAIADAEAIYNSGTATFEEVDAAITSLKIAEKYAEGGFSSATLDNPIATTFVNNGNFSSFSNDWPTGGWFTTAGVGNHGQMDEGESVYAWENYSWGSERLSGKMYYRMTDIPNGAYSVSIDGFSRTASSTYVYANKERVTLSSSEAYETVVIPVIVKNNILEIGEYSGKIDWMKIKNVSVSYTGDPLASYKNTIQSLIETGSGLDVTGIPTSVVSPMTADLSTYAGYNSYTEEEECTAAISALQTSVQKVQAYISAKATTDKMQALIDATNVYTTDAYNTFSAYITKFNNAGYSVSEANALNGVVFGTGWRSTAAVDDFLISAWDVSARDWSTYHVNTWSTIGDSGNPNFVAPCIEYWTDDNANLADKVMTATFDGLNPGDTYQVTATVCVGINTASSAPATGITLQLNDGAAVSVCTGEQVTTTRFYEGTFTASGLVGLDGKLNIKFNVTNTNVSWMTFRNVTYTKTANAAEATDDNFAALDAAILAAEGNTLGFEKDEYAPYENVEALEALAAAKYAEANYTSQIAITTATSALTGATWKANDAEVNAVYNGDFALSENDGAMSGWVTDHANGLGGAYHARAFVLTSGQTNYDKLETFGQGDGTRSCAYFRFDNTNSARDTKYSYGTSNGYTMPLKANTIYKLTAQAGGWGQVDKTFQIAVVSSNDANIVAQNLKTPSKAISDGGSAIDYEMYFVVPSAGDYKLVLTNTSGADNAVAVSNIELYSTDELIFADGAVPTYAPGTYPSVKITRTLTAGRWATAVYPFAVSGVDNIAVLDSYNSGTGVLEFTSATKSTANEPFFMRSTDGATEISLSNVDVEAVAANPAVTKSEASLKGTYAATDIDAGTNVKNYVLSDNTIYPVGTDGATINPYRAYIQIAQPTSARLRFVIDGNDATGIESIAAETGSVLDGQVYDLSGRLVKNPTKGLYIVNGKKVLVK